MYTTNNIQLLNNIDLLVQKHNISRNKLLKDCGINSSFFTDLKKKDTSPSLNKIITIANYFNVTFEYLITNSNNVTSDLSQNVEVNLEEQKLLKNYRALDHRGKTKINISIYDEFDRMEQNGDTTTAQ